MELMQWEGTFIIETKDINTGKSTTQVIHNRVMNTVLDQLVKTLKGENSDLEIKYLALGTSNIPVSLTDTKLGNEIFRTPIVSQIVAGTGEITTDFTILETEAIGDIEEIGIFGGSTATASADTGTLISRILWSKVKTNSEEISFRRVDKIGRG
jgi:hypothetical protein